jgi:hypothetical protein
MNATQLLHELGRISGSTTLLGSQNNATFNGYIGELITLTTRRLIIRIARREQ